MSESNIKQVIIVRQDLKMPLGKTGVQVAHAAMSFITTRLRLSSVLAGVSGDCVYDATMTWDEMRWIKSGFPKICLRTEDEQTLLDLKSRAEEAGLTVHMITDLGKTVFNTPTITCIAIGPHEAKLIDPITQGLKLL